MFRIMAAVGIYLMAWNPLLHAGRPIWGTDGSDDFTVQEGSHGWERDTVFYVRASGVQILYKNSGEEGGDKDDVDKWELLEKQRDISSSESIEKYIRYGGNDEDEFLIAFPDGYRIVLKGYLLSCVNYTVCQCTLSRDEKYMIIGAADDVQDRQFFTFWKELNYVNAGVNIVHFRVMQPLLRRHNARPNLWDDVGAETRELSEGELSDGELVEGIGVAEGTGDQEEGEGELDDYGNYESCRCSAGFARGRSFYCANKTAFTCSLIRIKR